MSTLTFTVPGIPQGKGRARSGKTSDGRTIHYTPEKTVRYQHKVAHEATMAMNRQRPTDGPCAVVLDVIVQAPASWPKYKRAEALLGHIRPTTKPDLDNIAKAILDGCNGYVWKDDAQVVELNIAKRYGDEPMVVVTVISASACSGVQQQEIGL